MWTQFVYGEHFVVVCPHGWLLFSWRSYVGYGHSLRRPDFAVVLIMVVVINVKIEQLLGWSKAWCGFFSLGKDHFIFALEMRWDEREVYKVFLRSHKFFTGDTGFFLGLWSVCWKGVVLQWILWIPKNFYKSCNSVLREKARMSWKLLLKAEPKLSTGCRVLERARGFGLRYLLGSGKLQVLHCYPQFVHIKGIFLLLQTLNKVCFNLLSFT
jgi:hypothetical protein